MWIEKIIDTCSPTSKSDQNLAYTSRCLKEEIARPQNVLNISRDTSNKAKAIFTQEQFASIKNLASHASEATTSAIGPESVQTPQWFLAMNNALILLNEIFSLKY